MSVNNDQQSQHSMTPSSQFKTSKFTKSAYKYVAEYLGTQQGAQQSLRVVVDPKVQEKNLSMWSN